MVQRDDTSAADWRSGFDSRWVLFRKVAGYGWPGRSAKAVLPTEMRVRLPCLPLDAPMVKWTIIPRFERGVPGSNPGRGTWNWLTPMWLDAERQRSCKPPHAGANP